MFIFLRSKIEIERLLIGFQCLFFYPQQLGHGKDQNQHSGWVMKMIIIRVQKYGIHATKLMKLMKFMKAVLLESIMDNLFQKE